MIKTYLIPYYAALITSQWMLTLRQFIFSFKRKLFNRPHQVTLYYCVSDPYSHLLSQCIAPLKKTYNTKVNVVIVPPCNNIEDPTYLNYAFHDCLSLARQYSLVNFENVLLPSAKNIVLANTILLHKDNAQSIELLCSVSHALWSNNTEKLTELVTLLTPLTPNDIGKRLNHNLQILHTHGHYQSGMLHHEGEWYWALDRINLLTSRLHELGLNLNKTSNNAQPLLLPSITTQNFTSSNEKLNTPTTVDVYFSFRSPYSYIAIKRLLLLQEDGKVSINFKPILPMVMRGLSVHKSKRMYILHDAARTARYYQLPFGKICDPLGDGISHCINLFYYTKKHNKEYAFITNIMTGIWSQGLNINVIAQLKKQIINIGLDWELAQQYILENKGEIYAENNRLALEKIGLWGVPSFSIPQLNEEHIPTLNNTVFWGQDRLDALINIINTLNK